MSDKKNESERFFNTFFEEFPGIAFRGTIDFNVFFFFGKVKEITGYTSDEFLNGSVSWDEIIYPEDKAHLEGFNEIREIPGYSCNREYRIITKTGAIAWVEERIKNITDDKGKPAAVQGVIFDITQRKKLEIEKAETLESLRKAYSEIKTLRGIVPICVSCKQVRDDEGFWHQVEIYVRDHTEADFTHGLCPECYKKAINNYKKSS